MEFREDLVDRTVTGLEWPAKWQNDPVVILIIVAMRSTVEQEYNVAGNGESKQKPRPI
ncbi:hypothetical protein [Sphingomonas zeae]